MSVCDKINKKNYIPDFLDLNKRKIIEINGDYWHKNPSIYSDGILKKTKKDKTIVVDVWKKDKNKIEFYKKNNFSVLVLWEKDIVNDIDKELKKVKEFLNES
jgi:very-short-patch-repair endonuclease